VKDLLQVIIEQVGETIRYAIGNKTRTVCLICLLAAGTLVGSWWLRVLH
jgi:hypothetical protein